MAEKVLVELVDDLDGSIATQTIDFSLDGQNFEIDLNDRHAQQLRDLLGGWAQHAHRRPSPTELHQERLRLKTKVANQKVTEHIRRLASRHQQAVPEDNPQEQDVTLTTDTQPTDHDASRNCTQEGVTDTTGGLFLAPPSRPDLNGTNRASSPTAPPAAALFTSAS